MQCVTSGKNAGVESPHPLGSIGPAEYGIHMRGSQSAPNFLDSLAERCAHTMGDLSNCGHCRGHVPKDRVVGEVCVVGGCGSS